MNVLIKKNNISFQIIPEYNDGNNVLGTIKCSYKWHNYFPSDFKNIEEFENALNGCEKFLKENGISFKKLQNSKPILFQEETNEYLRD